MYNVAYTSIHGVLAQEFVRYISLVIIALHVVIVMYHMSTLCSKDLGSHNLTSDHIQRRKYQYYDTYK